MGRKVEIPAHPQRIISLVPSQTELLYYFGLSEKIIGITKFCVHPKEKIKHVTKIGGTKHFHFEKIKALQPDLIIGNKEENYKEGIEKLSLEFPVWMSDIYTFSDALDMILNLGEITGMTEISSDLAIKIENRFHQIEKSYLGTAAYVIWKEPLMVAAGDTFINEMLGKAGFRNAFQDLKRYPSIGTDLLKVRSPDYIFLSSEPFPFKERHIHEFEKLFPGKKIILVDGEIFSWYGNRLLLAPDYFKNLRKQLEN
jgi:ABC-type Fe3+-hydroxamate transport system substrate-binding protein